MSVILLVDGWMIELNYNSQPHNYVNKMGQCMELKDSSNIIHPLLGPLQEVRKDNQTFLLLNFSIINEEEYILLSKDIHKLKYNL